MATLHKRNDEILERSHSDRRFVQNAERGDRDRLEKLFELYTKMTSQPALRKKSANRTGGQ